uniref:HYLS1 centriolar and ciliogenesis associated n=1 Tax=Kryptolebias marmoratus TaxID=37003 RepID=A0A3Q3AK30_KRYMA
MENLDFSEEEIQEQLAFLGYKNIPKHRLLEFKQDLDELVQHGQWRNVTPTALINTKTQTTTTHSSPPTYIKEKGSREGFFLHAQITNHDRKVGQGCCESYAQHSVAPKLQLPPSAPNRLQVEPDTEDTLGSALSDSYTSSSDLQQRHYIKRKVLRKHKGKSHVCDESVYSEDVSSCLEERMAGLDLSTSAQKDFEAESENGTKSSDTDGTSLSAFESYIRGMVRNVNLPGFEIFIIRPVLSQQTVKKTDPVAKYFQYKQIWEMFKLPGESDRKALRREIKERLAYQPPPPKPQRVYVPNTYTVPTEKKRLALRWEVRNDLANGLIPQRFNYHL